MGLREAFNQTQEQARLDRIRALKRQLASTIEEEAKKLAADEAGKKAVYDWLTEKQNDVAYSFTAVLRLIARTEDSNVRMMEEMIGEILREYSDIGALILDLPYDAGDGDIITIRELSKGFNEYGDFRGAVRLIDERNGQRGSGFPDLSERVDALNAELYNKHKQSLDGFMKIHDQNMSRSGFVGRLKGEAKDVQDFKIKVLEDAVAAVKRVGEGGHDIIEKEYDDKINSLRARINHLAQCHFELTAAISAANPQAVQKALRDMDEKGVADAVFAAASPLFEQPEKNFVQLALETGAGNGADRAAIYRMLLEKGQPGEFKKVLEQLLAGSDRLPPAILKDAVAQYTKEVGGDIEKVRETLYFTPVGQNGLPVLAEAVRAAGSGSALVREMLGLLEYRLEEASVLRRAAAMVVEAESGDSALAVGLHSMADNIGGTYMPVSKTETVNIVHIATGNNVETMPGTPGARIAALAGDYLAARGEFISLQDQESQTRKILNPALMVIAKAEPLADKDGIYRLIYAMPELGESAKSVTANGDELERAVTMLMKKPGWAQVEGRLVNLALVDNAWIAKGTDGDAVINLMAAGCVYNVVTLRESAEALFKSAVENNGFVSAGSEILNLKSLDKVWFNPFDQENTEEGTLSFSAGASSGDVEMTRTQAAALIKRMEQEKGFFAITDSEALNPPNVQGMWFGYDEDSGEPVLNYALSGVEDGTEGLSNVEAHRLIDRFAGQQSADFVKLSDYDFARVSAMDLAVYNKETASLFFVLNGKPWSHDSIDRSAVEKIMEYMKNHPEKFMALSGDAAVNKKTLAQAGYNEESKGLECIFRDQDGENIAPVAMDRETAEAVIARMVDDGRDKNPPLSALEKEGQKQNPGPGGFNPS